MSGFLATVEASGHDGKEQGVETLSPTYPLEEVVKGNTLKAMWLEFHGPVADPTCSINEQPGGEEVLLEPAVADASESFKDAGPSSDARETPTQPYIVMCVQLAPNLNVLARAPG